MLGMVGSREKGGGGCTVRVCGGARWALVSVEEGTSLEQALAMLTWGL